MGGGLSYRLALKAREIPGSAEQVKSSWGGAGSPLHLMVPCRWQLLGGFGKPDLLSLGFECIHTEQVYLAEEVSQLWHLPPDANTALQVSSNRCPLCTCFLKLPSAFSMPTIPCGHPV